MNRIRANRGCAARAVAFLAIALLLTAPVVRAQPDKHTCTMLVDNFVQERVSERGQSATSFELSGLPRLKNTLKRLSRSSGIAFRFKARPSSINRLLDEGGHSNLSDAIHDDRTRQELEKIGVSHVLVPRYSLYEGKATVSVTVLDLQGDEVAQVSQSFRETELGGFDALAKQLLNLLCDQIGARRPSEGFEVYVIPPMLEKRKTTAGAPGGRLPLEAPDTPSTVKLDGEEVAVLLKVELANLDLPRMGEVELAQSQVCRDLLLLHGTGDRFIRIKLFVRKTGEGLEIDVVPLVLNRECKTDLETKVSLVGVLEGALHKELVRASKNAIKAEWMNKYEGGDP